MTTINHIDQRTRVAKSVIVVGAGAAGLIAAGRAGERGAQTNLLEKMPKPGLKLRITGKGRCNLGNIAEVESSISRFGPNGRFLRQAFARFFTQDLVHLLENENVPTVTERGGRIFPASDRAQDVVDALRRYALKNAKLYTRLGADHLIVEQNRIVGIKVGERILRCEAVILATGGASYPATGSTGDGYRMAREVGHTIVPIRPALVPLNTKGEKASRLNKLRLRNIQMTILIDGHKKVDYFGELEFTRFGVTGPVVLTGSRRVVDALRTGKKVELSIDLKPALDSSKLDARLLRDLNTHGKDTLRALLNRLLPRQLVPICIEEIGVPADRMGNQTSSDERRRLLNWLKDFRLVVTGHRGFSEAIITAGGVKLEEVNPRTMESRLIKNLYFAGEILDIDADTGGYNLQAAFSTGWLAGNSSAQAVSGSPK